MLYAAGSYLAGKLYENTLGYFWGGTQEPSSSPSEDFASGAQDRDYVNVELLDRVAASIQRWVDENRKEQAL